MRICRDTGKENGSCYRSDCPKARIFRTSPSDVYIPYPSPVDTEHSTDPEQTAPNHTTAKPMHTSGDDQTQLKPCPEAEAAVSAQSIQAPRACPFWLQGLGFKVSLGFARVSGNCSFLGAVCSLP